MRALSPSSSVRILIAQAKSGEAQAIADALRRAAHRAFEVAADGGDCVVVVTDDPRAAPTGLPSGAAGLPLIALARGGDGEQALCHPAYVGVLPLQAPGGVLAAMIGMALRIRESERRAAESELAVDAHARLAALGEVTASVGHELGNLLAILVAWTGRLKIEAAQLGPDQARVADVALKLDQVALRILRLINGLGMCSRGVNDQANLPHSVGDLLDHALAITAPRIRVRDVKLDVIGAAVGAVMVKCNPGQLTQALVALVSDAAQWATGTMERQVTVAAAVGEGEVELSFEVASANPAGASADGLSGAFAVSERILHSIVARHGGDVTVADDGGVRRRTLRLPSVRARPAVRTAAVLLVDDDPDILENLAMALAQAGIECERALSAEEALDKVAKRRFEVVISDIHMPGIDGLELAKRLEAASERPPRILLTTGYREHYSQRLTRVQVAEVVDKPYDARALAERVRAWLQ